MSDPIIAGMTRLSLTNDDDDDDVSISFIDYGALLTLLPRAEFVCRARLRLALSFHLW